MDRLFKASGEAKGKGLKGQGSTGAGEPGDGCSRYVNNGFEPWRAPGLGFGVLGLLEG